MKNSFKQKLFLIAVVLIVLPLLSNATTLAAEPVTTKTAVTATTTSKYDAKITQRVGHLNALITRVGEMNNLSTEQKSSIVNMVQALISDLNNLKTAIATEKASTTLIKQYEKNISQAYRVYSLFMPQINIMASVDRVVTAKNAMSIVGAKLEAKLATLPTISATDKANLEDLKKELANAESQASLALSIILPLAPDMGDKTKMAANTAALKDARAKLALAHKSLVGAHKDIQLLKKSIAKATANAVKTATSTNATSTTE